MNAHDNALLERTAVKHDRHHQDNLQESADDASREDDRNGDAGCV